MIDILSWILAAGVGFGISCWIFGNILDKSNNIGDYKGDRGDYNAYVNFRVTRQINKSEQSSFLYMHTEKIDTANEPQGTDLVRRMTDEEREQFKKRVPTGEFVSAKNGINSKKSFVDEYEKWEQETSNYGGLKGIFKPVEKEDDERSGL